MKFELANRDRSLSLFLRHPYPGALYMILIAIFFVCFVAYYFTNWKILSFLWKVG